MNNQSPSTDSVDREALIQEFLSFINLMRRFRPLHKDSLDPDHNSSYPPLTRSQIETMFCLFDDEHQEIKTLAEKQGVSSSAMTQLVDHLVNVHYLERNIDQVDRRAIRIKLTDAGLKIVKHIRAHHQQNISRLLSCLDEQDLIDLKRIYQKLAKNLSINL